MKLRVSLIVSLAAAFFAVKGDWRLFAAFMGVAAVIALGDLSVAIRKAVKR